MPVEQLDNIWQRRLDSVVNFATILSERYILGADDREETLRELCLRLGQFGRQQFNFFAQGFGQAGEIRLQAYLDDARNNDITPDHVFSVILDQLADDLMVIQRALEQRIVSRLRSPSGDRLPTQKKVFKTLDVADKLAWSARAMLEPYLVPSEPEEQPTVLSYFHKAPNARIIPYAPVVLVGIPTTTLDYQTDETAWTRDFLAIPHEFAHHVYWYGRDFPKHAGKPPEDVPFLRKLLEEKCAALPAIVQNWCEEIFADVVGCLIGGPVVALSMIDMLSAERGSQLAVDNGVHPLPLLRPYIYTETLKQIGMAAIGAELEKRWAKHARKLGYPLPDKAEANWQCLIISRAATGQVGGSQIISLEDLVYVVQKIIELLPLLSPAATQRWSDGTTTVDALYRAFDEKIEVIINPISVSELTRKPTENWPEQWQKLVKNLRLLGDDELPESGNLDSEKWIKLLRFGGWTTEGPGSPRVGG